VTHNREEADVPSPDGFSLIRQCPACGTKNRVAARHLTDVARCGACKATLGPVAEPIDVDSAAFDDIVRSVRRPILVDFWAAWCGPCRVAAPVVRQLAREMAGRALVLKVDTEAHPGFGDRFRVRAIPNFLVISSGRTVLQHPGLASLDQMQQWLEQAAHAP
jgi:thioredoxin 2